MGNTSGIKWNGINDAGTLQSSYEIILRDTKTNNEEKILLPDFFNQAITLGLIPGYWTQSGGNLYPTTLSDNVGIGTNTPAFKLDVLGKARFAEVNSTFLFQETSLNILIDDASGATTSYEQNVGGIAFQTNTTVASYGRIEILEDKVLLQKDNTFGNVGIGTDTPTSKLTIANGDAEVLGSANGVILESPDNTRYRVTVANGGTLTVTAV